jgi:hypothetical protein
VSNGWQSATLRYSAARRSRKQIVLLLVLDCAISDYENEDDDEDERFARPATTCRQDAGSTFGVTSKHR